MTSWREFGSTTSSSGVAWALERDEDREGRFRMTFTRDDVTVRHSFDMDARVDKRLAALPGTDKEENVEVAFIPAWLTDPKPALSPDEPF